MCESCGCSDHVHTHAHGDHGHFHDHPEHLHEAPRKIKIETDILHQNNMLAQRNRGYFEARNITALNIVSSPGSGKTTLLEKTVTLMAERKIYVIEGDQQTSLDAERMQATGAIALQVNTGNGCHLDAGMIHQAVHQLNPEPSSLLLIENVGNLVCPALFDLGENYRVVIISVTEGEDKPLKYPNMFQTAHVCIINKIDLLPYLDLKTEILKNNALKVNPSLKFIELSAKTGKGMEEWVKTIENYQII